MSTGRVELVMHALSIEPKKTRPDRIWALCPYHDDHDPSWMIRTERGDRYGKHRCFSCGAGGSLADLVMHMKGYAYGEARDWIFKLTGGKEVERGRTATAIRLSMPSSARRFELPKEIRFGPLEEWPTPPREYLQERGITPEQVERWGIGYAAHGRLAGRIALVIRDREHVPAGWHARAFGDQDSRYLYPSTADGADLDVLFGEERWPPPWSRHAVFVTEGGFDALAIERTLITIPTVAWVAAIGGSTSRAGHFLRLATFQHVIIATDNDRAGNKIATEIKAGLARVTRVTRLELPEKVDANKLERQDPEELARRCAHAVKPSTH